MGMFEKSSLFHHLLESYILSVTKVKDWAQNLKIAINITILHFIFIAGGNISWKPSNHLVKE